MSNAKNIKSGLSKSSTRKFETFSYLPAMDEDRIRKQVVYAVNKGWDLALEHTEPENALSHYWYMWKLPMFGEKNVDVILEQAAACHKVNPKHHVRLIGYDNYTQSQGTAMVIYHGPLKPELRSIT